MQIRITMVSLLLGIACIITPSISSPVHAQSADPSLMPVIPEIGESMKAHLQQILAKGIKQGNRPDVFAKVGDSITESGSFLVDIGCKEFNLGTYTELADTIAYFSKVTFPSSYTSAWCGVANSFTRSSRSAVTGWNSEDALRPFDPPVQDCPVPVNTPLLCELHLIKPGFALIMYGTNDLESRNDLDLFRHNMTVIVTQTISAGTIPILSTIPPRTDFPARNSRVVAYNRVIIEVAQANQIPVMNYWRALTGPGMVNRGISDDGIHPNLYGECHPDCKSTDFTPQGLRFGYNQRNLIALQTLAEIKAIVLEEP